MDDIVLRHRAFVQQACGSLGGLADLFEARASEMPRGRCMLPSSAFCVQVELHIEPQIRSRLIVTGCKAPN